MSHPKPSQAPAIVLASTSPYRRCLLQRLALPFSCHGAAVDETPQTGENAKALVQRLALSKAQTVAKQHPDCLIIGGDQAATDGHRIIGKPGSEALAVAQLQQASGRCITFYTGTVVIGPGDGPTRAHLDCTTVHFRQLQNDEIDRYVAAEKPLDCAGAFKCEGLGITLFDAIDNNDPTALMGLPLIALAAMLRQAGWAVP